MSHDPTASRVVACLRTLPYRQASVNRLCRELQLTTLQVMRAVEELGRRGRVFHDGLNPRSMVRLPHQEQAPPGGHSNAVREAA